MRAVMKDISGLIIHLNSSKNFVRSLLSGLGKGRVLEEGVDGGDLPVLAVASAYNFEKLDFVLMDASLAGNWVSSFGWLVVMS